MPSDLCSQVLESSSLLTLHLLHLLHLLATVEPDRKLGENREQTVPVTALVFVGGQECDFHCFRSILKWSCRKASMKITADDAVLLQDDGWL